MELARGIVKADTSEGAVVTLVDHVVKRVRRAFEDDERTVVQPAVVDVDDELRIDSSYCLALPGEGGALRVGPAAVGNGDRSMQQTVVGRHDPKRPLANQLLDNPVPRFRRHLLGLCCRLGIHFASSHFRPCSSIAGSTCLDAAQSLAVSNRNRDGAERQTDDRREPRGVRTYRVARRLTEPPGRALPGCRRVPIPTCDPLLSGPMSGKPGNARPGGAATSVWVSLQRARGRPGRHDLLQGDRCAGAS